MPLSPSLILLHLKLMQRKTLNFVINLPDVKHVTERLDSILTEVSIVKRFYTLEFILSVQSQICSILNIMKLREIERNQYYEFLMRRKDEKLISLLAKLQRDRTEWH